MLKRIDLQLGFRTDPKRLPTPHTSSPVGVTSHITPLPTGEGKGEGPTGAGGEATVSSVRDNVFLSSKPFKKKKRPSTRSTVISE